MAQLLEYAKHVNYDEACTRIEDFLSSLYCEDLEILDFVNIGGLDIEDPFFDIESTIRDNHGFNVEIIYYTVAMDYLREHDPSLTDSMNIAAEYGYEAQNIDSELLASLLASRQTETQFYELRTEIEVFFEEIVELLDEVHDIISESGE